MPAGRVLLGRGDPTGSECLAGAVPRRSCNFRAGGGVVAPTAVLRWIVAAGRRLATGAVCRAVRSNPKRSPHGFWCLSELVSASSPQALYSVVPSSGSSPRSLQTIASAYIPSLQPLSRLLFGSGGVTTLAQWIAHQHRPDKTPNAMIGNPIGFYLGQFGEKDAFAVTIGAVPAIAFALSGIMVGMASGSVGAQTMILAPFFFCGHFGALCWVLAALPGLAHPHTHFGSLIHHPDLEHIPLTGTDWGRLSSSSAHIEVRGAQFFVAPHRITQSGPGISGLQFSSSAKRLSLT